ncbi:MAG: hypothetical protein V8R30_06985 [Clostridia bacterium]
MKNKIDNVELKANNLLNELFRTREDSIYNFTDNERKLLSKKSKDYSNIYIAIDNIPDGFIETINGIKTSIENYIETLNEIQGIENEKFYEEGFSDAIQLILECINNKHEL